MKKIAALMLSFILIFSLAACSNTQNEESSQSAESTPVEAPETESSGGELFSIRTVEPYPDGYDETIDVGQSEKNNGIRPELSTHIEKFDDYDTIFVGFPNWWYGMPMVMYSFFDEYDFSGKTIIPFCTSGGSAFSDAISEITNMEPDATVLDGFHIGGSSVNDAESRVNEWVSELGLLK